MRSSRLSAVPAPSRYVATVPSQSEAVATAPGSGVSVLSRPTWWTPVVALAGIIMLLIGLAIYKAYKEGAKGVEGAVKESARNIGLTLTNIVVITVTAVIGIVSLKLAFANLVADLDRSKAPFVLWFNAHVIKPVAAVFAAA